jgi:hypothetical protein
MEKMMTKEDYEEEKKSLQILIDCAANDYTYKYYSVKLMLLQHKYKGQAK